MNIKTTLFSLLLTLPLVVSAAPKLSSPDGQIAFEFFSHGSSMHYSLTYQGRPVVTDGQLGVLVDNHLVESAMGVARDTARLWTSQLRLMTVDTLSVDSKWKPLYGECSEVRDRYRQLTLHFATIVPNGDMDDGYDKRRSYLLDVVVRAYDEGVAIRYHFPEDSNGLFMHVVEELTSFVFAPGTKAWHEAWAQGPYNLVGLTQTAKVDRQGQGADCKSGVWRDETERPLYLALPNGLQVALLEAGLHDYVRGKLKLKRDNELQVSMYGSADVIPPYDTPWRVIMVGKHPVDLINNKQIVLNLNAPCAIRDTGFIRPGKVFRAGQLDDKNIRRAIDFAADFGLSYVELDAGWYGPEMQMASSALSVDDKRDFSIPALCSYAAGKGVGLWLYVNQRALYTQLDSILPLYRKWGVKGIKFGFVQVGSQQWTIWLHEAVKKCATYGLMVDIHDEYRPTGWSRTYPNLLTQEGVRGNEEMPDAGHNTVLPFTRFLAGPADYTLCYFNNRLKTTKAHQLAMAVVYYSPLQFLFWYDRPDAYKGEQELEFWKHCPTVWDESIALDGSPGDYIVQVRRSGNDWFAGVLNGKAARTLSIDTGRFLVKGHKYMVELYEDDLSLSTRTHVASKRFPVTGGKSLTLKLFPSGGAALRFVNVGR